MVIVYFSGYHMAVILLTSPTHQVNPVKGMSKEDLSDP